MDHSQILEEKTLKKPFTIFGEPIIKTRCQRNGLISGISGGVVSGLVTFLFTSNPKKSTYIGFGCFTALTFSMACYCAYDEYIRRKEARAIKKVIYELNMSKKRTESSDVDIKLQND